MQTIHSEAHRLHHGQAELIDGMLKPCFEMPSRIDMILEQVRASGLGAVIEPESFGPGPRQRVHTPAFLAFLEHAWDRWSALGRTHDALPLVWPVRDLRGDREPEHIDGQMGFFAMDAGVPITAGTWRAACSAVDVALTGARRLFQGDRAAFALCRPPGHHAAAGYMGGYCYLNNAAIAAQWWRDQGASRIAILDVDYHHGNGTQSIFWADPSVLFVSLHADPRTEYPYFAGFADEQGAGDGLGFNLNLPMPHGTDWDRYRVALETACGAIARFSPDALVVSLGVDTFEQDPISAFRLRGDDYLRMGEAIGALGLRTLFAMEGGYAVSEIGLNAVNVLVGFEGAAR
jgi:acetoin utilization deacetylase AcuC-like enzyme